MAVHAHPDDETITMGGTLALLADRGVETSVVCCTDGKLATIVHPDMPEETTRPRLAEIRKEELRNACSVLGVSEVRFLDFGDSGMAGEPSNDAPGAFWSTPIDTAVRAVLVEIRRFRPHVVLTYDSNGGYGHPDHIQTHRATLLAVEAAHGPLYPDAGARWRVSKLYYSAFPVSWARRAAEFAKQAGTDPPFGMENVDDLPFLTPDEEVTTRVETRGTVQGFRRALRSHRSQIPEDWPQLVIPEELAEEWAVEHFVLALSRTPPVLPETDLLAGVEDGSPAASAAPVAAAAVSGRRDPA
jgi:N-acetyl-1-D-myo-inositol-2-amino-2-deoxy-alpha-D-glucopyranoside deacetylase